MGAFAISGIHLWNSRVKINPQKIMKELKYRPDIFTNLAAAKRYAERCTKLHFVVMGDNNKFWVVCFLDAQRLEKDGYEIVR